MRDYCDLWNEALEDEFEKKMFCAWLILKKVFLEPSSNKYLTYVFKFSFLKSLGVEAV